MIRQLFVTAVGTASGKTFVCRGIARALTGRGLRVAALKPIETGCDPDPLDALALGHASCQPDLARDPNFYRAALPLSPRAVSLRTGAPAPDVPALAGRVRHLAQTYDFTLVEGAGGLLVPLDATATLADLATALGYPLLLVAPDQLGVLSHVLTAYESASARALSIAAVILVRTQAADDDPSVVDNAKILGERLPSPVLAFPTSADDDDALAVAARDSGLTRLLHQ